MNRFGRVCVCVFVWMVALVSVSWAGPRVAVMDFDNKTPHGGWRVGRGAADILTTELTKMGKFDMFEREQLQSVIKEQDLGASGRIDPSSAAKIGKIIGVSYIVTGAVTEYGQSRGGGGGGGVNVGKVGYHSSVDVRIVDATTGWIVFADSGSYSKSSVKVKVFGFGGGESFNEKHATEAMRGAVKEVAAKIAKINLKSTKGGGGAAPAGKALIADVDGNTVMLNKGKNAGFEKGQTVAIFRKGKTIKDPATGKVLKVKYKKVGDIKLTAVEDSYCEGEAISGSGFKVGDIVR